MTASLPQDRLREAFVVLSEDDLAAWSKVISRSGRLKTSRADLLGRTRLAFERDDPVAADSLRRALLRSAPDVPDRARRLLAVLAACQLIELFSANSSTATEAKHIDAAAVGVRILSRTSRGVFPDLVEHADRWLARRGEAVRDLSGVPGTQSVVAVQLDPLTVPTTDAVHGEGLRDAHNSIADQMPKLNELIEGLGQVPEVLARLAHHQLLLAEQQQIGWWLLSDHSAGQVGWEWAYDRATELNELTRVLPGPRASYELLRRKLVLPASWVPGDVVLQLPDSLGVPLFSPALELLRGRVTTLAPPESAHEAALAIYDELILARLVAA